MFSGKREKALEEELERVKEQKARMEEKLSWISGLEGEVSGQFSQIEESREQMERDLNQVREHIRQVGELTAESGKAAEDVHGTMMELNNGVGTFEVNHSVFLEQVRRQNERIMEIVENNKHFTTPMKHISEAPAVVRDEAKELMTSVERMKDFSKSMTVISLNAAIEAGRMGEPGRKFVAAAEEICSCSEYYDREARILEEKLKESDAKWEALEEQIRHLNELLKDNNISMGKLMRDCMQSMATYEVSQLKLREMLPDAVVVQADTLQQSERELSRLKERMELQMEDIRNECETQREGLAKLEDICSGLCGRAGESDR